MCRIHPEAQLDLYDLNNFIFDNTLQGIFVQFYELLFYDLN